MNLENLKDDITQSADQAIIDKPQLKNRASDLVQVIRSTMQAEILIQLIVLAFLFCTPFILPFAELPRAVFFIFTFIIGLMTLSYCIVLFKFLRQTSDLTANTRNVLTNFIFEAKISVSSYIAYVVAGCSMLPILVFTLYTGTSLNFAASDTFEKWFLLRLSGWEFAQLIACFLTNVLGSFLVTKYWAQFCYGRHIRKLERLVQELDAQ